MQRFDEAPYSEKDLLDAMEMHLLHMQVYSMWRIGLTSDPDKRYDELEERSFWCHWRARNAEVAQRVMQHFASKGMKPQTPVPPGATCVYIY
jgi:hypothetical protein